MADTAFFHSAHHPDTRISQIGRLGSAMYLAADRFVFVDDSSQELVFVSLGSNVVAWAGHMGEGPHEFKSVRLLTESSIGGVVVWDAEHRRMNIVRVVNGEGVVADLPGYDKSSLRSSLLTQPVARYTDGTLVFQGSELPSANVFELSAPRDQGHFRDTIQYWLAVPGEPRRLIVEALGSESFSSYLPQKSRSRATMGVIFGHSVLHTQVGEHLAVAQTDLGSVRVFDHQGRKVVEVPMPQGVAVSKEQVDAVRERLIAANEDMANRIRQTQGDGFNYARGVALRSDHIRAAPANEIAPPIDRMQGDLDGRLWLRLFRPGETRRRWQVWDLTEPRLVFTLVLPEGEGFLDAAGDRVLLRARDEFDVYYLVIREIVR